MAGSTRLIETGAATALVMAFCLSARADLAEGLARLSSDERNAIAALCDGERSSIARQLCTENQVAGIARLGRRPDLSVASPAVRQAMRAACPARPLLAEQFACERAELKSAHLPVRDAPGGAPLTPQPDRAGPAPSLFEPPRPPAFGYFSLRDWRRERPPMPPAFRGPPIAESELREKLESSVYVVLASDHAIELAERVPHAQGGAVAITPSILLTNCHVIDGRPEIMLSQKGLTMRARLVYADPGGDRCFLRADARVHPVAGVRPARELKLGEPVYSVGAPEGREGALGRGAVTAFRSLDGVRFIQNTAPTAHGSSGGGLFDQAGNLIGITTAIATASPTTSFSIAADEFWP